MREAIQTSRDLTMAAALASDNEEVIIDGSGYTGKKLMSNGTYDPRQVKITGKTIVLTDDAWETCKVAIGELLLGEGESIYGVNAQAIIGDITVTKYNNSYYHSLQYKFGNATGYYALFGNFKGGRRKW